MARPKSDKPTKSESASVRLTKEQKEEIIILFGSVQKFLEIAIVKNLKKK
jgi:hypothetical protein